MVVPSVKFYIRSLVCLALALSAYRAQAQTPVKDSSFTTSSVFLPKYTYKSGQENWSVATADMNKDGNIDIISASKVDASINIHYNDGTGGFLPPKSFRSQPENRSLTAFDANGDGWPDIACVTRYGKLLVMLNDKSGMLLPPTDVLVTGEQAHDVTAADINADGKIDLLVAVVKTDAVNIYYGMGGGGFREAIPIYTGDQPRSVKVADLNGDKRLDIIAGCDDGRVYIFLNNGTGTFDESTRTSIRSGAANWGLGTGDLDNDGDIDIATASYEDKKMCIHLNNGDATFAQERCMVSGDHNFDLVVADFNLDGNLDIATASTIDKLINIHLNQGKGVFKTRETTLSGDWNACLATGDFDNDGDMDLVTGSINDNNLNVHQNVTVEIKPGEVRPPCVSGYVIEAASQTRVPRAPVILVGENNATQTTLTDMNGFYKFCPDVGKTYEIRVRVEGLPPYKGRFTMPTEELENDLYLKMASGAVIYGKVVNLRTNQPMAGAEVEIRDKSNYLVGRLKTNAKGGYMMEVPFGRDYSIIASSPTYDTTMKAFSVLETDANKNFRFDLLLSPEKPPLLFGRTINVETSAPIVKATVEVRDMRGTVIATAISDEQGRYSCSLPYDPGTYQVVGMHYMYDDADVQVSVVAPTGSKKIRQDVMLLGKAQPLLTGRLLNDETGAPIVGGMVEIRDAQSRQIAVLTSDAQGNYKYSFQFLDAKYRVTATATACDTLTADIMIQKTDGNKRFVKDFRLTIHKTAKFYGQVRVDDTKEPIKAAHVIIRNKTTGKQVADLQTDEFGRYETALEFGSYEATIKANGFLFFSANFQVTTDDIRKGKNVNADLQRMRAGAKVALNNIYFASGDSTLTAESDAEIKNLLDLLMANPTLKVEIGGHTDNAGTEDVNARISQGRANAVVRALIAKGISVDRLLAKGFGSSQPMAPNDTPANRQLNRRTEVRVISL